MAQRQKVAELMPPDSDVTGAEVSSREDDNSSEENRLIARNTNPFFKGHEDKANAAF